MLRNEECKADNHSAAIKQAPHIISHILEQNWK
jgi:hypothetical protein